MAAHLPEDLTGTCWRDDLYLQHRGLNLGNVLEYFALSPFCGRDPDGAATTAAGPGLQQLLRLSSGVEYALQDAQPPHLYVIRRQLRTSGGEAAVGQACYYVLDGTVYQAPSLYAALSSRMRRCIFGVKEAFEGLRRDLDPLAPGGAPGPAQQLSSALEAELAARQDLPRQLTAADRQQEQRIGQNLGVVLAKHPLPSMNHKQQTAPAAAQRQPTPSLVATAVPVPGVPSGAGSKEV